MRISDWSSDVCSSDLEDIHASGDILLQLVDRVLNLTWAEAHSREPDSEALADLSECLETCRRVVEPIARLRGLDMTVPPSPSMPKLRSEEQTSALQSLMTILYAVFSLKKKTTP